MFPNPINIYEVKLMEQRKLVAAATERSRLITTAAPAQGALSIPGNVRQILSAALDRMVMLLPDSRDGLRSKEHELAAVGIIWPPDPVHDEMLARQLEAARARRQAGCPAPESNAPAAGSALQPWAPSVSELPAVPVPV